MLARVDSLAARHPSWDPNGPRALVQICLKSVIGLQSHTCAVLRSGFDALPVQLRWLIVRRHRRCSTPTGSRRSTSTTSSLSPDSRPPGGRLGGRRSPGLSTPLPAWLSRPRLRLKSDVRLTDLARASRTSNTGQIAPPCHSDRCSSCPKAAVPGQPRGETGDLICPARTRCRNQSACGQVSPW